MNSHGGLKPPLLGAVLLALLATSCGSVKDGEIGNSGNAGEAPTVTVKGSSASSGSRPKPAAAVLKQSADAVRGAVNSVVRPTEQLSVRQEKTLDVAASCKIGSSGLWPRRWGYARRVVLSGSQVVVGRNAVATLRSEGWQVEVNATTEDVVDADARLEGVVLHLTAEPNPPSLLVEGFGACVQADGSVVIE